MQNGTETKMMEQLVDELLKKLQEANQIEELEFHKRPDDDCFLSNYIIAKKYSELRKAKIILTNAGRKSSEESNPSRVSMDIGGGPYDHHVKGFGRKTSADLVAERLGLLNDPGLQPLLAMVRKVDNAEKLFEDSIHFVIEGLPRKYHKNGDVDWTQVRDKTFELFDSVYDQTVLKAQSARDLKEYAIWVSLSNRIKICKILWHPELRDAAFDAGASVVFWTKARGKNTFWANLSTNRELSNFRLNRVSEELKKAEAKKRGISTDGLNLLFPGQTPPIPGWYLGNNGRFLMCGSRTNPISNEECTKLTPSEIEGIIEKTLSFIPKQIVDSWGKKS